MRGERQTPPRLVSAEAEARLISLAAPSFDEFLVLRFNATNSSPFPFSLDYIKPRPIWTTAPFLVG